MGKKRQFYIIELVYFHTTNAAIIGKNLNSSDSPISPPPTNTQHTLDFGGWQGWTVMGSIREDNSVKACYGLDARQIPKDYYGMKRVYSLSVM